MPKPTSRQKVLRQYIDAKIQFHSLDQLQQFFAAAAKFLIEERHWDNKHPVTAFDNDLAIQAFHNGFEQFSRDKMRRRTNGSIGEEAAIIELLKMASGWPGKNLKWPKAKKRLTKLRQEMKKRFIRNGRSEGRPLRGLMFYDSIIRREYLTAEPRKPVERERLAYSLSQNA